jgi:hypothetical protein
MAMVKKQSTMFILSRKQRKALPPTKHNKVTSEISNPTTKAKNEKNKEH